MGVQRRRLRFNSCIAQAISWEHGFLMSLIPNQFKDTIHFDSLHIMGLGLQVRLGSV